MFPQVKPVDGTVDPSNVAAAFMELITKAVAENVRKAQTVGAPLGPYVHGPGGLFGVRGLSQAVISTHTQITGSLGEVIPVQTSIDTQPLFPYITGFQRSDTQEKNAVCDNPEDANSFKTCIQTTVFGRKEFKTRQVEINRIGQRLNRGEFLDLNLENDPLVEQMGGLMQGFFGLTNQSSILAGREMVMRLVEVGVAYQRWFCPQVYTGNPANSSAGGGYKEFPGLDLLISRTKVDALTGASCPSLYSDVKDFSYRQVSSTADPDIYRTLSTMMYILETKAIQQNLSPVDLRLVMRPQLFFELTRFWPQQYNTDGATLTNAGLDVLILENVRMRDEMRSGQFLNINSKRYPVILDPCIMEENQADNGAIPIGGFASDIYVVPFAARGGSIRTLYWEYYDYRNDVIPAVRDARADAWYWTDSGAFLWHIKPPDNWCLEVISKVEPRLILRTPQLAGRLQNVTYVPLQHTDDVLPSQDYWVNGGVTTGRPAPSPFSEWNLSGPGFNN